MARRLELVLCCLLAAPAWGDATAPTRNEPHVQIYLSETGESATFVDLWPQDILRASVRQADGTRIYGHFVQLQEGAYNEVLAEIDGFNRGPLVSLLYRRCPDFRKVIVITPPRDAPITATCPDKSLDRLLQSLSTIIEAYK